MAREERSHVGISQEARDCIEATSDTYSVSAETFNYCLAGDAGLRDPRHLRLLIDCCEVCQTAQNSLLRGSEVSTMLAAVCVEACEQLAESCRALDGSDDQLIRCAEQCDEAADCCRKLAI
jgi:hypothetical protein